MKLETPQEVQVWYIIPAMRRLIAQNMLQIGVKQKEIAKYLNLSGAAVSQYLSNKRGTEVEFPDDVKKEIFLSTNKMIRNESSYLAEVERLLRFMKEDKSICAVCRPHTGVATSCKVCYT